MENFMFGIENLIYYQYLKSFIVMSFSDQITQSTGIKFSSTSKYGRNEKGAFKCIQFCSVQLLSHVRLFVTPWIAACQASLSITNSQSSLKLTSIELVMPSSIQPSHALSSPSPPAPNPSRHQSLFQWVNSSHEVAKVLEFQLQHQSFQWTPRTDLL